MPRFDCGILTADAGDVVTGLHAIKDFYRDGMSPPKRIEF